MPILQADPIPIREEADGSLRIGNTRVLLEIVINAFEDGATPETIVDGYPSVRLSDVYAVISYYLNHREEVTEYLRLRDRRAAEVAALIASTQRDLSGVRHRLLSSRDSGEGRDAPACR